MNVSPARFAEQLRYLARRARVISLAEGVRELAEERPARPFVAITFDDAYRDNFTVALPLLERLGLAATLFVPAGVVDDQREFWWDRLQHLLLEPSTFAPVIEMRIGGVEHRWPLGGDARYDDVRAAAHRQWRIWNPRPTYRHVLYAELHTLLFPLSYAEQHAALDMLESQRLDGRTVPRHPVQSWDELRSVAASSHCEIGAHSLTHPVLARLAPAAQATEVRGSRERLESVLGARVRTFAYPYGTADSFTSETTQLVRDAGFLCACTNVAGAVGSAADPYTLPRVQVKDWNSRQLARQLRHWRSA